MNVFALKLWPNSSNTPQANFSPPNGPAIILVRGDNSASCNTIHELVEQAAEHYGDRIKVIQTDWTPDNPLIKYYQVRFLPAVIFIGRDGNEVDRIMGESEAIQNQLSLALTQAETLLE